MYSVMKIKKSFALTSITTTLVYVLLTWFVHEDPLYLFGALLEMLNGDVSGRLTFLSFCFAKIFIDFVIKSFLPDVLYETHEKEKDDVPEIYWNWYGQPESPGQYIVCREDGKIHLEQYNGSGWAYNGKVIKYWAELTPPDEFKGKK